MSEDTNVIIRSGKSKRTGNTMAKRKKDNSTDNDVPEG
jgi:hypothetical protein